MYSPQVISRNALLLLWLKIGLAATSDICEEGKNTLVLWLSLFYFTSAGDTQTLICIDVPLLLTILDGLSLPFFFFKDHQFLC